MTTLENICVKLDLISVEQMKCFTTLELLMMVIKKLNEVIEESNRLNDLFGDGLIEDISKVLMEWLDDGTI